MKKDQPIPVTQRAYTLRLNRVPGTCLTCKQGDCACWREALWATHEAVNKGAKAFGDWLLMLRGGLDHALADSPVQAKGGKSRAPTDEECRSRRALLALSWLSVEDECGAPRGDGLRVATGRDTASDRGNKVKAALREILMCRQVKKAEIDGWLNDCGPSLEAQIREDAVWVNRSAMFDEAYRRWPSLKREDARSVLEEFFRDISRYLSLPAAPGDDDTSVAVGSDDGVEFRNIARRWISFNFGTGEKSDNAAIAEKLDKFAGMDFGRSGIKTGSELATAVAKMVETKATGDLDKTLDSIRLAIGWKTGRQSKGRLALETACREERVETSDLETLKKKLGEEAAKKKGAGRSVHSWVKNFKGSLEADIGIKFVTGRDLIGEYSTMLEHAARRVSAAHSWIKLAEQRRHAFKEDALKLNNLRVRAPKAIQWLDQFCAERSAASGASAEGGYRIRKRAVAEWARVVKAWTRSSCKTEDDRISAAREAQADPEVEKFGDIQLFEALAADDDAVHVWRNDQGEPDASILIDYAAGTTAEDNERRFKVPAYRHPDALRHPVFCDFGNSRWTIKFAIHEVFKVRNGGKRVTRNDSDWIGNRHGLRMGLWDGRSVDAVNLRWSSKRLMADLALDDAVDADASGVVRADRLGRAASGAFGCVSIMNVFHEKEWNGRLQVPRSQLDRIAALMDKGNHRRAETLRQRLRWLISFSPRLQPSGPFIEYAASLGIAPNRKGQFYPNAPANKEREGLAKLGLSRLPKLRVLSVDLGHRFAAACAVWEALPLADFKKETEGLKALAGGSGNDALYLHVEKPGKNRKPRTIIYRRIGTDTLDGKEHPAPWARLDRQFLIKLQGEEEPARKASPAELESVRKWESACGRVRDDFDPLPRRVDLLMSESVTTLRRALRCHGDHARIAFNLTTQEKLTPGGGRQPLDRAGRVDSLTQTLVLWHDLFSGKGWTDPWAAEEWQRRGLPEIGTSDDAPGDAEDRLGAARRARRKKLEAVLRPHAESLVDQDLSAWSASWTARWKQDDLAWSGKSGVLHALKHWIAPRGLRPLPTDDEATRTNKRAARAAGRYIGGLSVNRINTVSGLYQLLKAFKMRPEPDDPRKNVPKKGEDELADFNRRLLDVRDRLREQRVKQLASRIVEAALGVGRVKGKSVVAGVARPRKPMDAPCHTVVIESLTHYRPDDLRTRRENRMLMQWSSSKVQKFLNEGCQLYGLYLREVPANYTSRQCSRTGLPGVRCADFPVKEFQTSPWWNKEVKAARTKVENDSSDAEAHFLVDLADRLKTDDKTLPRTVRVPRQGGDLFVSAPPSVNSQLRVLQADLNAAANIGLRALMDPDFPGRWWYVPCRNSDGVPLPEKVRGSACFGQDPAKFGALLKAAPPNDSGKAAPRSRGRGEKSKEITNVWSDPSTRPLNPLDKGGFWLSTSAYWRGVRKRVVEALRQTNGLLAKAPEAGR